MLQHLHDPAAFTAFVREHQDRVFNLVLNRVQQAEDAEEITQDVFLAVYRDPGAFRGQSAVSTWLCRIAINKSIDHLRKKRTRQSGLLGKWKSAWPEKGREKEPVEFNHPGLQAENREKGKALFQALRKLSDKQYTAWVLVEMDGRSYAEVSEIMQLSESAVESLLFRSRKQLKKILESMYRGD